MARGTLKPMGDGGTAPTTYFFITDQKSSKKGFYIQSLVNVIGNPGDEYDFEIVKGENRVPGTNIKQRFAKNPIKV